jgi:CubicO group peptidase (beta-lactamase class C family)
MEKILSISWRFAKLNTNYGWQKRIKAMKKIYLIIFLLPLLQACAQNAKQEVKDKRVTQLDSFFTKAYDDGKFTGNILIAEKGEVLYQKSFGKADRSKNKDLNAESIFELASVSKQFTAMGIMLLVQQGKLKYEDSLRKFFPQLPYYNITVKNLLQHTSGLPDYMAEFMKSWDDKRIATNADMITLLATNKPPTVFSPGTKWEYSNTGYALLASIIEKASGKTFHDYLEENIFKPLGMKNTLVFSRRYEKRNLDNYAYGYVLKPGSTQFVLPDSLSETATMVYCLDGIVGDGTVNSTTGDLLKWDRALYTEKLLPKAALNEAFKPGILSNGDTTTYGYGWGIAKNKQFGAIVNHSGGWPGYSTFIDRHITNDKTIIILQNNGLPIASVAAVRNILYGIQEQKPVGVKVTADELKQYVGEYELAPEFILSVTVNGEKIFAQATGQVAIEIFKEKENTFFLKVVEAKLVFERDSSGKVIAVTLFQGGEEVKGKKIK